MFKKFIVVVSALSIAAAVTASVAPAAKKKTYKVTMSMDVANPTSTTASGAVKAKKPLGKGAIVTKGSVVAPPVTHLVLKFKDGTITLDSKDAHAVGATIHSTAKVSKGTGKFKGITGKLTTTAPLARNADKSRTFTYKGKVKF